MVGGCWTGEGTYLAWYQATPWAARVFPYQADRRAFIPFASLVQPVELWSKVSTHLLVCVIELDRQAPFYARPFAESSLH